MSDHFTQVLISLALAAILSALTEVTMVRAGLLLLPVLWQFASPPKQNGYQVVTAALLNGKAVLDFLPRSRLQRTKPGLGSLQTGHNAIVLLPCHAHDFRFVFQGSFAEHRMWRRLQLNCEGIAYLRR